MSKRTVTILLMIVVFLATIVWMARPAMIVFHRWCFNTLNEYITNPVSVDSNGRSNVDVTKAGPEHEYHMRRLVELGVIAKTEFVMTNMVGSSRERSRFFEKLLAKDCPKFLYWSSVDQASPMPTVLDVWCELDDRADWIAFLELENKLVEAPPEQHIAPE